MPCPTRYDLFICARVSQYDASRGVYYTGDSANVSRLIESLMRGYDKRLRPNYKGSCIHWCMFFNFVSIAHISNIRDNKQWHN